MMGSWECGRTDDGAVDNDKLGHVYDTVKGIPTWIIPKQTWRESSRRFGQNETNYLRHGVGVINK